MMTRWGPEIQNDPFYNPNFSRTGGLFQELSITALRLPIGRASHDVPEAANRMTRLAASAD